MEAALTAALLADAGLKAAVKGRIDWLLRPQGSKTPAISLQFISANVDYRMDGRDRLVGRLVQMDVWAGSFSDLVKTRDALVAALDAMVGGSIRAAFIETERHTREAQDGPDTVGAISFFRASLDVRVWSVDP